MTDVMEEAKVETIKISYSKAQAFKTCKYKYKLAHVEMHNPDAKKPGLMPITKSPALERGTHGHLIMEWFHKAVKKELEFPYETGECKRLMSDAIVRGIALDGNLTMEISKQLIEYACNVFPYKNWRVLEVEKEYRIPVGIDAKSGLQKVVPCTIDLVVDISGVIVIVDHKFAADPYSDDRIEIEPQLPVYIGVLRALGVPVSYGIYNFMRTRKMKEVAEQVVQKPCRPNDIRIKASFADHLYTVQDIIVFQQEDKRATRTPGNNCDYCDFKKICKLELKGEDTTLMKSANFLPNDYGYEDL